ncbi:interleukin-2 receptor subunit beta isoform X2 [Misgurnus anguillicaudatus]|uniref:interleukin-2 receptor subunit beta isoform X2 n=1 Tax=Misgurnus anguillicaudatus TaxID=75329 RepID=UPI003CCFD844
MARMQNQTVIITVMMMMMLRLHSALTDQSLECYNDYYNTFTCVWNTSNVQPPITPQTNCSLHVEVKKRSSITETQQMSIKGSDLNIRTASVEFKTPGGIIIGAAIISEKVLCENFDAPVSQTQHRGDDSVVKVLPPVGVKVDGLNVSWSFASPKSTLLFQGHVFELQYRSAEQSWTDSDSVQINDPHIQFNEDHLYLHQPYVLRVRAKLLNKPNAIWSEWSSEYSWKSDVGKSRPTPSGSFTPALNTESFQVWITFTGVGLSIIFIFIILFKCNKIKWVQKIHSSYIPDPSKYFTDLNSYHKGNFVSWLGSAFALESFVTVDSEFVSPVEVVKLQDACDSHRLDARGAALNEGWENTSKSSNFSNSTYFLSQSSNDPNDTLEPCSAHCSYGPAGGDILPNSADVARGVGKDEMFELESSLKRLEQLRQDTQSPDSGFAVGSEDSMEESDLPSPLGLNLTPHPLLGLPAPHPHKHLFLGWDQTPLVLGPNRLMPSIDLDLKLLGSCGMIEPSSDDYMPVKNVQN